MALSNYVEGKSNEHGKQNREYVTLRCTNLSSLSVPANNRIFCTGQDKNFSERPSYLAQKHLRITASTNQRRDSVEMHLKTKTTMVKMA